MSAREIQWNCRLSKEEWDRLDRLSSFYGLDRVSLIRMLLKERERELFPDGNSMRKVAKR